MRLSLRLRRCIFTFRTVSASWQAERWPALRVAFEPSHWQDKGAQLCCCCAVMVMMGTVPEGEAESTGAQEGQDVTSKQES